MFRGEMKSYSVPWINIIVIVLFLYVLCDTTIKSIFDPTYHIRRIPRAVFWYFTVYYFYKCLTTAYKISLFEDGSIKLCSILRSTSIDTTEIIKINSYIMFVDIVTKRGNFSVSSLMEGVSNIKKVLLPLVKDKPEKEEPNEIDVKKVIDGKKVLKICFIIILIVFAVYIEWQQVMLLIN
jgi:hypothetical protein